MEKYKIRKPIRLIELFAGIGAQAMALRNLGVNFEHYKVVEFDEEPLTSYNAIHNTNFEPINIMNLDAKDLEIVDRDKYDYIMTYSFPCTSISTAGKQEGMAKGSNTSSSLLWEVERLINELGDELPQILLMENVQQVKSAKNIKHFNAWISFLEKKGYKNYVEILDATNFGIPQTRKRCFMVSILGNYEYKFPKAIPLTKNIFDILEDNVDESFYITNPEDGRFQKQALETFNLNDVEYGDIVDAFNKKVIKDKLLRTITTRPEGFKTAQLIVTKDNRLRKITPKECWLAMGFAEDDYNKASKVMKYKKKKLYKQAGNSIVVNVLMNIFKELF